MKDGKLHIQPVVGDFIPVIATDETEKTINSSFVDFDENILDVTPFTGNLFFVKYLDVHRYLKKGICCLVHEHVEKTKHFIIYFKLVILHGNFCAHLF